MNLKFLFTFGLALVLFACTPIQWPGETFGSPGGYMKTVKVIPRLDICDPDAYIDGYRSGYMRTWNQEISKNIETYGSALKQNPQDTQAQANYRLYNGKLFNLDSVNKKETRYGFVPSSVTCESDSYNMGRGQGTKDAARDFDTLRTPEPK